MSWEYKVGEEALREMVQVIVDEVNPVQIILFGSRARGDAKPDSDLDFLIIESEPFDGRRSRREEMARLWRALARFHCPKDILVYAKDEVEYWRDSLNSVVARALREGKVIYERP